MVCRNDVAEPWNGRCYTRWVGQRADISIGGVVREMGILAQSSNFQNCIKTTNKIPDYAKDFRKEWLCIRGINKECGNFIKRLDFLFYK